MRIPFYQIIESIQCRKEKKKGTCVFCPFACKFCTLRSCNNQPDFIMFIVTSGNSDRSAVCNFRFIFFFGPNTICIFWNFSFHEFVSCWTKCGTVMLLIQLNNIDTKHYINSKCTIILLLIISISRKHRPLVCILIYNSVCVIQIYVIYVSDVCVYIIPLSLLLIAL